MTFDPGGNHMNFTRTVGNVLVGTAIVIIVFAFFGVAMVFLGYD